jgi:beta-galactosidase/beta-glucuronidase
VENSLRTQLVHIDRRQFIATALCALPGIAHASPLAATQLKDHPPVAAYSLAGIWKFSLDPKSEGVANSWFKSSLPNRIELPGSCEQRGFGFRPEQVEVRRLTHVLKYVGRAWYQREIVIPEEWSGKRVELFLERCHWETTVWVDGEKNGTQNSLSVPHIYDLGQLATGSHTLTICVDNSYKIPIGTWAHAIIEDTQGN